MVVVSNAPYDWAKEDWTFEDHIRDAFLEPITQDVEMIDGHTWTTTHYADGAVSVRADHGELDLGVIVEMPEHEVWTYDPQP